MKNIMIILSLFTSFMYSPGCMGQDNRNQINMDSIKSQSLCILDETDEMTVYLTYLVRIVEKAGDEKKSYAGGDEIFLRYETWTIPKKGNRYIQDRAILHSTPERIATVNGGSYDTAAFYLLPEDRVYYENGKPKEHAGLSDEWTYAGLASDNGIYTQIDNYFHQNKAKTPVIQENIKKGRL